MRARQDAMDATSLVPADDAEDRHGVDHRSPGGLLDKPAKGRYTAGPLARVAALIPLLLTITPTACFVQRQMNQTGSENCECGFLTPE
jgi:hypothetical protein